MSLRILDWSRGIQVAYAGAHYGKSLFWYMTELLFGFYLAEVYQIPPGTIGTLLFAFLFWDAITDPLVSNLLWRRPASTRSLIRFQLVGAILSSTTMVLVFLKPAFGPTGLIAYALIVGLAFRTAYTIFDVPQNALLPRLARTMSERLFLSSIRIALSALATLTVSIASALIIVGPASSGMEPAFAYTASAFCGVAIISALLLQVSARNLQDEPKFERTKGSNLNIGATLRDPALQRIFAGTFFLSLGWPFFTKIIPFFGVYVLNEPEYVGSLLATVAIANLASQPIWIRLGLRLTRDKLLVIFTAAVCASSIGFFLFALEGPIPTVITVALLAAATSALAMLAWTLLSDYVAESGAAKVNDVLAFGLFSFFSKLAFGLGGLALGGVLALADYVPGIAINASGKSLIVGAMAIAPFACTALAVFALKPITLQGSARNRR